MGFAAETQPIEFLTALRHEAWQGGDLYELIWCVSKRWQQACDVLCHERAVLHFSVTDRQQQGDQDISASCWNMSHKLSCGTDHSGPDLGK